MHHRAFGGGVCIGADAFDDGQSTWTGPDDAHLPSTHRRSLSSGISTVCAYKNTPSTVDGRVGVIILEPWPVRRAVRHGRTGRPGVVSAVRQRAQWVRGHRHARLGGQRQYGTRCRPYGPAARVEDWRKSTAWMLELVIWAPRRGAWYPSGLKTAPGARLSIVDRRTPGGFTRAGPVPARGGPLPPT